MLKIFCLILPVQSRLATKFPPIFAAFSIVYYMIIKHIQHYLDISEDILYKTKHFNSLNN